MKNKTILIVDDEPLNVDLLEAKLTPMQYKTILAYNGEEALEKAVNESPDLILLDIMMPVMNGYEVCRRLKADKRLQDIPVIFLTAMREEDQEAKGLEIGAVDYITKPFSMPILKARVQTHLKLKRYRDHLKDLVMKRTSELVKANKQLKREIKERKRADEDRIRLIAAIEQAVENVIITKNDGTIWYVNPSFEQVSGYSRKEVIGKNVNIIESDKHNEVFYKALRDTIVRGDPWTGHIINKKKDGTFYEVEATISPVRDNKGTIINYVFVQRDVTYEVELKRQLDQAQKMEAIGKLAGGIAHDINNILFPIMGYTEMSMEDVSEESEAYKNLEQISKGTRRAKELVSQILTFSRRSEEKNKPVKLHLIVEEVLKLIRASMPSTIEIRQNIDSESGVVMADPTKMHQVIMNLCTNAYHAMQETGGVIEVKLTDFYINQFTSFMNLKPGPYLKLSVSDTGHGMDRALMERIFEPYFTTKNQREGTGMGLSVVHGIIKSYGGDINVSSYAGEGSTFDVYMPQTSASPVESETKPVTPAPKGKECILLVDDEADIIRMMQKMLVGLGYQVSAHNDSIKALDVFRAQPKTFALVITDQIMPNMTGTELARKIMDIRSDIPIIVCSGADEKITDEEAKALGIREHIKKPVEKIQLSKTIRRVLDQDKVSILVIDDDDQIRAMLRKMLERSGYEVDEASDGMEGIMRYRQKPAELIITDILMPRRDGKETILEIKKEFPDVKIIAISGGGWIGPEMDLDIAGKLGAVRTFTKPIQQEKLLEAVRELLDQSK